MFKTLKEYDYAMYQILKVALDGNDASNVASKFGTNDGLEALGKCIELKYLSGFAASRNALGNYVLQITSTPLKVTYEGLRFIDTVERQFGM